jgi:hypothetical protein|tara:strand:- start:385 stop:822 length:438 start_codon:yes stop_codon:yes gene_type:complete
MNEVDKKAFKEMLKITDPFDPLFAPSTGKSIGKLNEELEAEWMGENVKMGYPPDLGLPGGSVTKLVKTLKRLPKKELGKVLKAFGERVRKYRKKDPVAMKKYVEDQAKVAEEIAKFESSLAGKPKAIGKFVSRFSNTKPFKEIIK